MTSDVVTDAAYGLIPICLSPEGPRFLLILHNKGHWGFPKGHADPGESPEQTARREFQEETGLVTGPLFPNLSFTEQYEFLKRKKERWVHKTVIYFVGEVEPTSDGQPPAATIQPKEIADFRWCSYSQALVLLSYDVGRQMLKDCDRALSTV